MGGSSKKQTVGYRYFLGMHIILTRGPADRLLRIKFDGKSAWVGNADTSSFTIDAPELFGGESREGGVSGVVDLEMGKPDQGVNSYLTQWLGGYVPAFRSVVGLVLRDFYLGVNPYLKLPEFRLVRIHRRQDGIAQWYDAKAEIGAPTAVPASFVDSCSSLANYVLTGIPNRIKTDGSVIYNDADVADNNTMATKAFSEKIFVTNASFNVMVSARNLGDAMRIAFLNAAGAQVFQFFPCMEASINAARLSALNSQANTIGAAPLVVGTWYKVNLAFDATGCDVTITRNSDGVIFATTRLNGILGSSIAQVRFVRDGDGSMGGNTPCATKFDDIRIDGFFVIDDMNPAHIIRECLTDPDWGMGYQDADIDDVVFQAAADQLFAEGMGMSLLWDRQSSIEDFIKEVVKHIDASLFVDRQTGKFVLKLIRDDYDLGDLVLLDPSNIDKVTNFGRPTFGELTNSISVGYWDSATGTDASLTVQDIALSQMQGAVINTTIQYPGFTHQSIAARVAERDLKTLSTPLASCTIYANSDAAGLNIGDCFKFSWPDYDMEEVPMRVTGIGFGDGRSNRVRLTCTQDVYSLPSESFIAPTPPAWEDPNSDATPATRRVVIEAPYYELVQRLGQTTTDQQIAANNDIGYLLASAAAPSGAINGRLAVDNGAGYEGNDYPMDFCPVGTLSGNMDYDDTVIPLSDFVASGSVEVGTHAQIGNELVKIVSVSSVSVTIGRGVLDTVPTAHLAGTTIFFWDAFADSDNVEYVSGESVDVKILPTTGCGTLAIADAPVDTVNFAARAFKPYAPGNLKIGGVAYPVTMAPTNPLALTWSHRDRLQQTAGTIVDTTAGNIGPEAGTTYEVKVYKEDLVTLIHTESGLSGTSYTYPYVDEVNDSAIFSGGGGTLYAAAVLADAPYVWYRLGESSGSTANDSSGNARHGTYAGTITKGVPGLQNGDSDTACLFDGTADNSQVTTPFTTNFTTAFTVEFLVTPDATQPNSGPMIVSKSSYFAASVNDFPFYVQYQLANQQVILSLDAGGDFTANLSLFSGVNSVPAGVKSLIQVVYRKNGQCEIWVNGVLKASSTIAFTIVSNARAWTFGKAGLENGGGVGTSCFSGVLDELAIYNFALSSTRIGVHATAVNTSPSGYRQNGKLRFTLESFRDGYPSFQKHDYTVSRTGYGFNYGERYGD